MLALLKGFDLEGSTPTDADFIHTWAECAKLAYADREAFYGDPKFVEVPIETLLSDPTTPSAVSWWANRPPWSSAPAPSRATAGA